MFQVYTLASFILLTKYFATIMYAANPDNHLQEDEITFGGNKRPPDENVKRRTRTAANDMENIPMHLAIFWSAFIVQNFCNASGNGQNETIALTCLIMIYTGLRLFYTVCYVFALQPWRTISFALSQMAIFAAAIVMVVSAFEVDASVIYPRLSS